MHDFFSLLRRFVRPYKRYIVLNIIFNLLAAFLTLFSFAVIVPILEILFKVNEGVYTFMPWDSGALKEVAINNFYYYTQLTIEQYGQATTLGLLAVPVSYTKSPSPRDISGAPIPCSG